MKKELVIFGLIILLVSVGSSGCDQITRDNRFIGTWTDQLETGSFTCLSDGTLTVSSGLLSGSGTWTFQNGKFVIQSDDYKAVYGYSFSNNDNTLTLTESNSGFSIIYTKQ